MSKRTYTMFVFEMSPCIRQIQWRSPELSTSSSEGLALGTITLTRASEHRRLALSEIKASAETLMMNRIALSSLTTLATLIRSRKSAAEAKQGGSRSQQPQQLWGSYSSIARAAAMATAEAGAAAATTVPAAVESAAKTEAETSHSY